MQAYTLGFIFDPSLSKVLLIEKQRPEWQKGKLNGIGGKIERGESSECCIVREVSEECALKTQEGEWISMGNMQNSSWRVDIYTLVYRGDLSDAVTTGDEKVDWFDIRNLPHNIHSNIPWLIHLALDKIRNNKFDQCAIRYYNK